MKWILAFVLLISFASYGQDDSTKYIWYKAQYGQRMPRGWWDSTAQLPYRDTNYTPSRPGAIVMRPADKHFYKWDGTAWGALGGPIITNAVTTGDTLLTAANTIKRLDHDATLVFSTNGTKILMGADTISYISTPAKLRDTAAELRRSISVKWYNIANAGADNTGVIDISSYITAAMAAGRRDIYLPKGKYLISSTVQMKDSVTIRGDGRQNTIIVLASNIPAFKLGHALGGYKCQFMDIGFEGTSGTSGDGTQTGILIDSVNGVFVHNVGGYKLGGWAVRIQRNGYCCGTYTITGPRGNIVSNIYVQECYGGVSLDTIAEYNTVDNSTVVNSKYGVFVAGGNSRVNNNNLSSNQYNLYITGGSNNGHGVATGNTFNHATNTNVYITGNTLGYAFSNNLIYAGTAQIFIENSDNVSFQGGDIVGSGNLTVNTSTNIHFNDVNMRTAPTWVISGTSPTVVRNGKVVNGISLLDVVNSKQFDITHTNGTVNFTGTGITKYRMSDTLSLLGSRLLAGGDGIADSLRISSSSTPFKGNILFGTSVYSESSNRLGIGITSPSAKLHVEDSTGVACDLLVRSRGTSINAAGRLLLANDANHLSQIFHGSVANAFAPDGLLIDNASGAGGIRVVSRAGDITFGNDVVIGSNEIMRLKFGTRRLGLGTNAPTAKLHVVGTGLVTDTLKLPNVAQKTDSTYKPLVVDASGNIFKGYWFGSGGGGSGITELTGDVTAGPGSGSVATTIAANAVTNSKFRQSAGLSIIGNSTNATANVDDITAASDHQVLRRSGTGIAFGSINLASSAAVTGILPIANGGTGLSALGTANQQLRVNSGGTALEYFTPSSASVSNDAYSSSWNGVTTTAPSQNAVYDKFESLIADSFELYNANGRGFSILRDVAPNESFLRNLLIRVNGTMADTSASTDSTMIADITISGAVSGTGTSGRVAFWNGTSSLSSDANFLYGSSTGLSIGTTNTQGRLNLGGNKDLASSGVQSYFAAATYNDATTAASGTASSFGINYIAEPTISATNASVTFPNIATLLVDAPVAGPNATITNGWAIETGVNGNVRVGGNLVVGAMESGGTAPTPSGAMAVVMVDADGKLSFLRPQTVTSAATVTPISGNNIVTISAQAVGLTIANPTGTFLDGQAFLIAVKDNGSSQTVAFGTDYTATDFSLTTPTVSGKWRYYQVVRNATANKFFVTGKSDEP